MSWSAVDLSEISEVETPTDGNPTQPQHQNTLPTLPHDDSDDDEELDYESLDGIGLVMTDESVPPVVLEPTTWKNVLKKYFLPEKGREKPYIVGIVIDVMIYTAWLILIFVLLDSETRNKYWYMPLLGICGGTVAMATPAGGGVFYFPALTILNVPARNVIAFNYGAQTTGMGLFGTFNWLRKSRSNVVLWLVFWFVIWGWAGSSLSVFAFPIQDDLALRIIFAVFSFLLIVYVCVGLKRGTLKSQHKEITPKSWKNLLGLAVTGFLGGILLGWISVGIDVAVFFALTAFWSVDSRRATITSILVVGWTSLLPLLVHIIRDKDVPYELWLMVTGGSIIGAKIGPLINKILGKKAMLIIFVIILAAEVIRTIIELAILPFVYPDDTNSTMT